MTATAFDFAAIVGAFDSIVGHIERRGVPQCDAEDIAGDVLRRLVTARPAQPFAHPRQMWRYVWKTTNFLILDYRRRTNCGTAPPMAAHDLSDALIVVGRMDTYTEPIDPTICAAVNGLPDDSRIALLGAAYGILPRELAQRYGGGPRRWHNHMRNARGVLRRRAAREGWAE